MARRDVVRQGNYLMNFHGGAMPVLAMLGLLAARSGEAGNGVVSRGRAGDTLVNFTWHGGVRQD